MKLKPHVYVSRYHCRLCWRFIVKKFSERIL